MTIEEMQLTFAKEAQQAASKNKALLDAMTRLLVCGLIHSEEYGGCNWRPSAEELLIFRAFDIDIGEHV